MTSNERRSAELFGVPCDLLAYWVEWSINTAVRSDLVPDSDELHEVEAIYLGHSTGTQAHPIGSKSQWAKVLPSLQNIRYLVQWSGNCTQQLFDAICKIRRLRRLCIGRLHATDLSAVHQFENLEYFCVFQVLGFKDLEPIVNISTLRSLELVIGPKFSDLSVLEKAHLPNVRYLSIHSEGPMHVPDMPSLPGFDSLEYLSFSSMIPKDADLTPILSLPSLKLVQLARRGWTDNQIAELRSNGIAVVFDTEMRIKRSSLLSVLSVSGPCGPKYPQSGQSAYICGCHPYQSQTKTRLTHHYHILETGNDSYRLKNSSTKNDTETKTKNKTKS